MMTTLCWVCEGCDKSQKQHPVTSASMLLNEPPCVEAIGDFQGALKGAKVLNIMLFQNLHHRSERRHCRFEQHLSF